MAETLRLKTNKKPTIFNKDMLYYGLLTPFAAVLVSAFLPESVGAFAVSGIAHYGAMAVGGLLGGLIGKRRIGKENVEGKEVKSPSVFNKKLVIGGLLASNLFGLAVTAVELIAGASAATMGAPLLLATLAGGLAALVTGAYFGGQSGKKEMEREYEEAKKQYIVEQIGQNISPEIGQAVEYTMEHKKDWGKKILEEKLLSATQEPSR